MYLLKPDGLYMDGCNLYDLAKRFQTPLQVFSYQQIIHNLNQYKDHFLTPYPNTRVAYASKAYLNLTLCKILEQEGFYLDVVSKGELYIALQAGFPAKKIEFNGNNKTDEELEYAIANKIGRIIIDSESEMLRIEQISKQKNFVSQILFRMNPQINSDTHGYIDTGRKDSKFGIEPSKISQLVAYAAGSSFLSYQGLHFHIGSQILKPSNYIEALKLCLNKILEINNAHSIITKEINLGGGFPAKYLKSDEIPPISEYITPLMRRIDNFFEEMNVERPAVILEPGRSIISDCACTLYTVGEIKEIPGVVTYVSVDGGMSDNIRPALYHAKYDALLVNKAMQDPVKTVTISGKCCESGDILIHDISLPQAKRNDVLAIFSTGAYTLSMASNYNQLLKPAVVMIKDQVPHLIVKRQNYSSFIENDQVPNFLSSAPSFFNK